tara:strand:+ start:1365 stop:2189 length:825 start_codon:yes stop_codon:yes gene_type:complete
MASVQLSQRLRDDITNAFTKELGKAYRKSYNIQESLDKVIYSLENSSDYLQDVIAMEKQYQLLLPDLAKTYNIQSIGHYHSRLVENLLKPNTQIGLVCNPNRPIENNLTFLKSWDAPYTEAYSNSDEVKQTNYLPDDVAVKIEDLKYYYPLSLSLSYERGWGEKQYAPHCTGDAVVIISDPELCKAFSPIGEIEDRIAKETETFKISLDKKNTLKQFLDDWPAGKSLVPQEAIQRMNTVKKRASTTKTVIDTIPDELKDSMNEVLLGNKLLGDD